MNRQASSSKYKISNPQPIQSSRGFGGNDGPYPSFPSQNGATQRGGMPSGQSYGGGGGGSNGLDNNEGSPGGGGGGDSPARPARSRLRDPPQPPNFPQPSRPERGDRPRQQLQPLQTQNLLRVSNEQDLSPITASSPIHAAPNPLSFADPFAADRSQRSQLRQQTTEAHQAKMTARNTPTQGSDKLRNVVGAFMAAGRKDSEQLRRPQRSEGRGKPVKREETWEIDAPDGSEFGEIDVVLKKIKKDWPFVLEGDFSPSTLALSLLSQTTSSTLPPHPSLSSFLRLHDTLSSALQAAVQAHFQTFAASLPQHASFLATLGRAQEQVQQSKRELSEARDGFAGKGKSELAGVRARERQVRDMLKILDTIDNLKGVPDRLETLIGDKKYIQAAVLLVRSSKTIRRPEIAEIGAMSELKAYFASQEITLSDILVEELHSHIYLKTFYSDSRWSIYNPGQHKLIEDDTRFSQYLQALTVKPSQDPMLEYLEGDIADVPVIPTIHRRAGSASMGQAGSSASLSSIAEGPVGEMANPEADSYAYIETILESLAVLGRLGVALERATQRVSNEIHTLIEATLDEVEERIEQRRNEAQDEPFSTAGRLSNTLEVGGPPHHAAILRDLFWTLYSKLAAVLEGHRIVYEVSRWISSRRDFRDQTIKGSATLNVPVLEIYKPIQNAVRMLLRSYLTDDTRSSLDSRPLMSLNEIIRDGKIARDRQKSLFKFADTDVRSVSNEVKAMDDTLQKILKTSVPGLLQAESVTVAEESEDSSHRNLIPPNVFNVSTLFQPTLAFIDRAAVIIPPGFAEESRAFSSVLEDFVVRIFLPQLDERVTASFQQAVSGYDAYQVDRKLASTVTKPPLKSSVRVMGLIHNLCVMLLTTPFHRENYSRLIVGVIVQYYQQCSARFKELASLSTADAPLSLPATWTQREDIIAVLTEMQAVIPSDVQELALISQREIKLELDLLKDKSLVETELIGSSRKFEALGQLAESLRWFIDSLLDIQVSADDAIKDPSTPKLPLTQAMSQRFDAIIQTYEQLTEMVLNTMRLEVRGRVLCNLGASMRAGDFVLESEALDLDPDVVDLNASLTESEEVARATLAEEDRAFVVRGLSYLADHMFVTSARSIKAINAAGVQKLKRNILSVQQCIRGLSRSQDDTLSRAMAYWDLYDAGPKQMLEDLKTGKPLFSFEDYNTMLNLQCKTSPTDPPSSELNTYLIDLHALSMSIEGWEIGEV